MPELPRQSNVGDGVGAHMFSAEYSHWAGKVEGRVIQTDPDTWVWIAARPTGKAKSGLAYTLFDAEHELEEAMEALA